MMAEPKYEDLNEEFNNFMHRVTEVSDIVRKLSSHDANQQSIGIAEADRLLQNNSTNETQKMVEELGDGFEDKVVLQVKSNRTLINKRAFENSNDDDNSNGECQSPEAFMREVSKDAEKRYRDKLVRTERMETFKKQATSAFRRGDYAKALCRYNQAIEQIRDSPLLYNNRAIVCIRLKMYEKAVEDAQLALRLNETCLKSFLLLAKAAFLLNKRQLFEETIAKAKETNGKQVKYIEEFVEELESGTSQVF